LASVVNVNLNVTYNSAMWLDDANLNETEEYFDVNLMVSSTEMVINKTIIGVQVNNLFNALQYSNFRANAFGNRYFEAASPMHFGLFLQYKM